MSATITDYFNKASNMNGSYPAVATVTAARSTGGSTLSCDDLSSWATDTPVHFSTFKVNTDGSIDTSTQTDWKGIVNGNTITDLTRLAGAADSGNASGDRVELNPTIGWLDDLVTGLLVSHKQNGGLKDSAVTENAIATGAVTNTKLGDGSVTSAKIGTGAISSYDKIGDDVIQTCNLDDGAVTADKIDFTTFDTGWKKMTLPSGMSDSLSLTGGLWYRVVNGIVHLYGQIRKASGNFSSGETLAVFPNEAMPYSTATNDSEPFIGAVAGGIIVRTSIQNSDNKLIYNAGTSTSWIFYELSYKAKTS